MEKEEALEIKAAYEFYLAMMESPLGARITKALDEIKNSAIRVSMHGDPTLHMEARGKYQAVERLEREFSDIKKEYQEAEAVLRAEVIETPPADTSKSA